MPILSAALVASLALNPPAVAAPTGDDFAADGRLLWSEGFEVPADDVSLIAAAIGPVLRRGYAGFAPQGFTIVAAFDSDPLMIGERINDLMVQPVRLVRREPRAQPDGGVNPRLASLPVAAGKGGKSHDACSAGR